MDIKDSNQQQYKAENPDNGQIVEDNLEDPDDEVPNWLYEEDDPRNYFMPVNELKYTDELTVRRVYSLARLLSSLLEKIGLFYWTTGGTTLGIVRHGGLIPWDDDLDICILEQVRARQLLFSFKIIFIFKFFSFNLLIMKSGW